MSNKVNIDAVISRLLLESREEIGVIVKAKLRELANLLSDTVYTNLSLSLNEGLPSDQDWISAGAGGTASVQNMNGKDTLLISVDGNGEHKWAKKSIDPFNVNDWRLSFDIQVSDDSTDRDTEYFLINWEDGTNIILLKVFKDGYQIADEPRVMGYDFTGKMNDITIMTSQSSSSFKLYINGTEADDKPALQGDEIEGIFGVSSKANGKFECYITDVGLIKL